MFDRSVLRSSGQLWKLLVTIGLVFAGGAMMAFALAKVEALQPEHFLLIMLTAMLPVSAGLIFACTAIRCRAYGERWFWSALSRKTAGNWLVWLITQQSCPVCKKDVSANAT
jgi:ABC-type glycerol-3-phosphate transport system permease component